MSNRFLTSGSGNLSDGTENIIGSNIGAANLLAGSTVKVNNLKQFVSTDLLISDVRGLSSALGSRLSNPSPVPIYAPSFVKDGGTSSEYLMADGTTTTGGGGGGGTGSSGGWPASLLYTADMSAANLRPFSTFVSGDYFNFEARMFDLFGGESTFYSYTVRNSQSTIVYYKTGLIPSTVFNTSAETICNSINDTSGAEIGNNAYGRIWYQNNRFVLQLQSGPNVDERMDTYIYINSPQTMGINPQLWSFFDGTAPTDQTDLVVAVADYNLSSKLANQYQATWTPETDRYYTLAEVVSAMNATLTPVVVTNANTKSSPWLSTSNGNIVMLNTNFTLRVDTPAANLIMILPGDYGTLTNSTDPNTYTTLNSFPINLPTPVVGVVRWNTLAYPTVTKIWVTNKDISNVDYYATLSQSPIGSIFRIQHRNDSSNYKRFTLTGATEINALYTTFNVAFLNTGGPTYFETGEPLLIVLEGGAGGGGGSGATGPTGPTGPSGSNGTNGTSFVYRGVWDISTTYYFNESVTYNGLNYTGDEYAGVYVLNITSILGISPATSINWTKILPFGQQGNQGAQGVAGPTGPTGASGSFDKNTAGLFRWILLNPNIVVNNLTSVTIPRQSNSVIASNKNFPLANCGYIYSLTLPDISALGEGTGAVTGGNSFLVGMSCVGGFLYMDSLGVQRMNIWKRSGLSEIAVGTAILAPAGATYRIYYDGTSANITIQEPASTQGVVGYSYTVTTSILFSSFTEENVNMGFVGTQVSDPPVSITVNDISFVSAPVATIIPIGPTGATGATGAQGPAGLSSSHFTYTFSSQVTGSPPNGHLFINNAVPDNATSVVVSHRIKGGDDIDFLLQNVAVNSTIIIQQSTDSNVFIRYKVLSLTSGVGLVTYGLEFLETAGTIANNDEVLLIIQAGVGPVGATGPSTSVFDYKLDRVNTTVTGIASGTIRFNNALIPDSTQIWVHYLNEFGVDWQRLISLFPTGSRLVIQDKATANYALFVVNNVVRTANQYITIDVGYIQGINVPLLTDNLSVYLCNQYGFTPTITVGTVTTGAAGSSVIVTDSGTLGDAIFNFTIPRGDTGAAGSTETLEYTFAQANYYGTTPTFNLFNMATGGITHAGGSLTIGDNTGSSQLTKTYHIKSNVSSTANGAVSGWYGTTTGYKTYIGQGFKYTYSFGLLDTSTNAATRTMIGLSNGSAVNTLNATATVASITTQFIGIMQEVGENNFSFYTRGSSSNTTVDSGILCTTPTTAWYTLTIQNNVNSASVTLTLTRAVVGSVTTATQTFVCGNPNSISTSNASYVLMQRNMASVSGTTGAAVLALGGIKMYFR